MPENNDNTNKLVGSQYLDLDQLKADVKAANDLLSSIGKNISMDFEKSIEKQIKSSLDSVSKDVLQRIKEIQNLSSAATTTPVSSSSASFDVMKIKEQTDAVGNLTSVIVEGMDSAGNKIRQTIKDGGLLSTTFERLGDDAKIWAQIEAEQKAAQKAESELWKQIIAEEKQAKSEESVIMKSLIAEQEAYVKALQDREAAETAAVEARNRKNSESTYKQLFDEIDQREKIRKQVLEDLAREEEELKRARQEESDAIEEQIKRETEALKERNRVQAEREYAELFDQVGIDQYLESLSKQISLTEQLYDAQKREVYKSGSSTTEIESIQRQLVTEQNITKELIKQNPALKSNEKAILYLEQLAQKRKDGENEVTQAIKDQKEKYSEQQTIADQVLRSITHILTSAVSNAISSFWRNAQDYATSYYDQLNEIRIVTGKTEEDAIRMGQTYRNMAQSMSVTSSEIANAAVEFWRQGLNETEVNARLTSTIQYAKISSLEFKDAAEQMTAATNGMGLSASHVADVWAYLGDASASGADEIGQAMQKVAATAEEAGLSFEWLGAYIATISEKTRQAPEVIGTSLNSIISRIQSIKEKGYNEEDETKINDIAKALSTIDVALMDNQGNWRNLNDIFMDIAMQWNDLNDKTRSYIATTVAGTRQKNYFLTLMDDLKNVSDATGESSRAMELYKGALASAGTAANKYAIYQESITAAQDKMNASFEKLYSLLDSDLIKKWYEFWTLSAEGWAYILSGGDITPSVDTTSVIADLDSEISSITPQIQEYNTLYETRGRTSEQSKRMNSIIEELCSVYPPFQDMLKDSNGEFLSGSEALSIMNKELEYAIELRRTYSKYNLASSADDISGLESIVSMRQDQNNMSTVFDLINQASNFLGYGDPSKLDQVKMNAQGYEIDGNIERLIHRLYPDPEMQKKVENAWNSFYKEYWDNMARGFNSSRIASMNSQSNIQNEELQKSARSIMDFFLEYAGFDQLTDYAKTEAQSIANGIAEGITEADWEQGASYIHSLLYNRVSEAQSAYKQIYSDVEKWINSGSNEDFIYNLETEIENFNSIYGTAYTLESIIASITGDVKGLTSYSEDAEEQVDAFYSKLIKLQQSAQIEQRHDAGWIEEINQILDVLKSGDVDRITAMIEAFGNDDNSAWFDQMEKDLPWLTGMLLSLRDESGNILITPETVQAAYNAATEGIAIANKEAENFRKTVQSIREDYAAETGEKTGWADALTKLSGFAEMGKGWSDSSWNSSGFATYLKELDDSGVLEKITDALPYLKEFIALYVTELPDGTWTVNANAEAWAELGDNIERSKDSLLATLDAYREANKGVTDSEGQSAMKELNSAFSSGGWQAFNTKFNSYGSEMQTWLVKNSDAVLDYAEAWDDYTEAVKNSGSESDDAKSAMAKMQKAAKSLNREVDKISFEELENGQKVWDGFSKLIENAQGKGKEFSKTYGDMMGRVDDLSTALDALAYIQSSGEKDATALKNAYTDLASISGVSADALKSNLSPALWAIQSETDLASNTISNLISWISTMDGVTIDPSNINASLARISQQSLGTASDVATLVMQMLQVAGASVSMGSDGVVRVNFPNSGSASRYLANNKKATSGGGGSGSSAKNKNAKSDIEKMIELMDEIQSIRDHQLDQIQETRNYYETTGQLQGVIRFYEQEKNAILDNNSVLEENIKKIEALLPAKQKEVAGLDTSDEAYEQAAKDLKALQDAHQEYTKQLLENRTNVEELTQAIKKQNDEIRDMEIELRETILDAIKDREELNERMLQGTIDVENEILDIIKARYEKERDEIIETSEARRDALEQEKDQLDEQLEARRKAAEQEDKQLKLAQLQAKLERISADPTRRKEELELRKEIAELRDEMAWDLAEQEVEAQKESIDQQIDSLDEYIEYVEQYYEELFKNPQKLIEEMKSIISKTDAEIIDFLKKNSDDYAASTEAAQKSMVNSWNEMLRDMHGSIEDYWDEVEQIIAGGDDAIIEFLKQNSADYKEAGKLQAEAYVDQWKQQLEDLRKAHKEITEEIKNTKYDPVLSYTGSSGSSGSGSGGKGTTSTGGTTDKKPTTVYYLTINGKIVGNPVFSESEAAKIAYLTRKSGSYQDTDNISYTSKIIAYAKGGLANYTGPAWIDGSPSAPERILSPYQTELFEDMIKTLHNIKINAASMPKISYDQANGGSSFSFGDIVVNVDKLENDSDYELIANHIMEQIMDSIGRGSAVGGIRITH